METKEVATLPKSEPGALYETQSVEYASRQLAQLQAFVKANMKEGRDFGIVPGCKKPSLWKPGAEKLLNFNGLSVILDPVTAQTIVDFKSNFLSYTYRASVINPRTGAVLATCDGNCNSAESKYAYEKDARKIMNTLVKMSQKRALVGAALIACRASDNFTDAEEPQDDVSESSPAKDTAKPTKSAEPSGDSVTFIPKQVTTKEGSGAKGPWKKYGVLSPEGDWYGTFDSELGEAALQAKEKGAPVTLTFSDDGKFKTIKTLTA